MRTERDCGVQAILTWCASILGPCEIVSGDGRYHGRTTVWRLRAAAGYAYAKIHRERSYWANEVHGYEQWAGAFGDRAPRLLAVRDEEPLALIVTELSGTQMEQAQLAPAQELAIWRAAGRALVALHDLDVGDCFGPCLRSGDCAPPRITDAQAYVSSEFDRWTQRGLDAECLSAEDLAIVRAASRLIPSYCGECPTSCHRDYGPANWLVDGDGTWAGVIDFEFAYWDVRVSDFCRYPDFEWVNRPELLDAFFDGYGRPLTPREEEQCLVGHALYALGAVVWGHEHEYLDYAGDGRNALEHLGRLLP